jgi:hypothetical protein
MQKHLSLIIMGLLIVTLCQPIFCIKSVKAQGVQLGSLAADSPGLRYGMNCETPHYTEMAYTDVVMESGWGGTPSLGSNGYPNAAGANVQLFFSLFGDNPGQQIYNFYGEGIFNVYPNGNFAGGVVPGSLQQTVNSDGVTITRAQFIWNIPQPVAGGFNLAQGIPLSWINIEKINPTGDPKNWPKNFHLIRPGYPAWQDGDSFYPVTATSFPIFTQEYLKSFAPFCCIRFMDWMQTNSNTGLSWGSGSTLVNSGPFSWSQRPQLTPFSSNIGIAYENMIALCNATNCDMWINVPLQATDDWKVGFANLVANDPKYHLNSNLHVYYEHGNELWNWSFIAWQLVDQWAQTDFGPSWVNHGQEMGKLLMSDVVIMQPIFSQVSSNFGRPIAAGQFANAASYCGGMLSYIQNNFGPPKNFIYGMAGAPYFGSDPTEFNGADLTEMQANMKLANQYGIKMCAYEGGQGLPSTPEATYDTNFSFQETSAMATQYNLFAQMWQQNGGDLCNFFTNTDIWSKFGYWGHLPLGSYINRLSDPVCIRWVTAASIAAACNCGNAVPPPSSASTTGSGSSPSGSSGSSPSGSTNATASSGSNGSPNNNSNRQSNLSPGGTPKSR